VSSVYNSKLRSSWFTQQILGQSDLALQLEIFTPERIRPSQSVSAKYQVRSILDLPNRLEKTNNAMVFYNVEDCIEFSLVSLFLKQYPGAVLLHDFSLLRMEIQRLSHGTVGHEITERIRSTHGPESVDVGTEFVLGKSVEIFSNFYDFLKSTIDSSPLTVVFGSSAKNYLGQKGINTSVVNIETPKELKDVVITPLRILAIRRSLLSKVGKDLAPYFEGLGDHLLINVEKSGDKYYFDIQKCLNKQSVEDTIEVNRVNCILEVGNQPLDGLTAYSLCGYYNGLKVLVEESLDSRCFNFSSENYYSKASTFSAIIDKYFDCKLTSGYSNFDVQSFVRQLVELYSGHRPMIEEKIRKKMQMRSDVLTALRFQITNGEDEAALFDSTNIAPYRQQLDSAFKDLFLSADKYNETEQY